MRDLPRVASLPKLAGPCKGSGRFFQVFFTFFIPLCGNRGYDSRGPPLPLTNTEQRYFRWILGPYPPRLGNEIPFPEQFSRADLFGDRFEA